MILRHHRAIRSVLVAGLLLAVAAATVWAQGGRIVGLIVDEDGNPMPGVAITASLVAAERSAAVEQIHGERRQESLQVPDGLSARLRQRSRAFRANALVGAFDAECLEFQDICQQRESCRCDPQGLFHCGRYGRVARHDDQTMPSIPQEVKQKSARSVLQHANRWRDVTGRCGKQ